MSLQSAPRHHLRPRLRRRHNAFTSSTWLQHVDLIAYLDHCICYPCEKVHSLPGPKEQRDNAKLWPGRVLARNDIISFDNTERYWSELHHLCKRLQTTPHLYSPSTIPEPIQHTTIGAGSHTYALETPRSYAMRSATICSIDSACCVPPYLAFRLLSTCQPVHMPALQLHRLGSNILSPRQL